MGHGTLPIRPECASGTPIRQSAARHWSKWSWHAPVAEIGCVIRQERVVRTLAVMSWTPCALRCPDRPPRGRARGRAGPWRLRQRDALGRALGAGAIRRPWRPRTPDADGRRDAQPTLAATARLRRRRPRRPRPSSSSSPLASPTTRPTATPSSSSAWRCSSGSARPPTRRSTPRPRPRSEAARRLRPDDAAAARRPRRPPARAARVRRRARDRRRRPWRSTRRSSGAGGVVVDALVELGRYEEASEAVDRLVSPAPRTCPASPGCRTSASCRETCRARSTRCSAAAAAPGLAPENTAFALSLVGHLEQQNGDAGRGPRRLRGRPPTSCRPRPIARRPRSARRRGRRPRRRPADQFERAAAILPLPEYVIALGETLEAAGDTAAAQKQYDLARAQIALLEAGGVVVDLDLALFEADHGDAARALELAEAAYAATPTVRAADALAWALHRAGRDDEAWRSRPGSPAARLAATRCSTTTPGPSRLARGDDDRRPRPPRAGAPDGRRVLGDRRRRGAPAPRSARRPDRRDARIHPTGRDPRTTAGRKHR